MSPTRIIIGLLISGAILAGELAAFWFFGLSAQWVAIVLFVLVGLGGCLIVEIQVRKSLRRYWDRACTGFCWRRKFPATPKEEIREFLTVFVTAFGFRQKRRCCFLPDDRVMEIYQALYPPGTLADSMELETLCKMLAKRYGVDFAAIWRDDITLGDIFETSTASD